MKRILALLLAMIMMMSFVACGEEDEVTEKDADNASVVDSDDNTGNTDDAEDPQDSLVDVPAEDELTAVREELKADAEMQGLGDITAMEFYENGVRIAASAIDEARDNKKIYHTGATKRVVNYPDGYIIDIPSDWVPDYSLSMRSRYDSDEVSLIATREDYGITYHHGVTAYLDAMYLFLKNKDFQANNGVTVIEQEKTTSMGGGWSVMTYRVKLENCKPGTKCYYTYVDFYSTKNETVHMMFKSVDDRTFEDVIRSFECIDRKGYAADNWTYPQANNPGWNDTTTAYYENLMQQDHVDWGIFSYRLQSTGWKIDIPLFEHKLGYEFPIISEYTHFGYQDGAGVTPNAFPTAFAEKVEKDGRMLQMTYQYTVNNNSDLTGYNPILDIYRETDEAIGILADFAEGAAEFDQPFFFRLNNEMNTDWTSYCAMANMLDPDIFIDTWITLHDLFTETGANEYAMWVFNGFDTSYPPYNWCDYRCYMPDAQYVDLIGLTGYNMGTGANGWGSWKSFSELYDGICEKAGYSEYFGDWPWIISEFGCVSRDRVGQDLEAKAEWISEMFDCFEQNKYPNIKVAVWFNCNDYDANGNITNRLVIDNDPEIVEAFKEGLERTQP